MIRNLDENTHSSFGSKENYNPDRATSSPIYPPLQTQDLEYL